MCTLSNRPLIDFTGHFFQQSTHEKWRHRRKLLTSAFHFKILDDSLKVFNRQSDIFADVIKGDLNMDDVNDKDKNVVDLFPYLARLTLDIILETSMGRSLNIQVSNFCILNFVEMLFKK